MALDSMQLEGGYRPEHTWLQRTVLLKKDPQTNGFGFTISTEYPVFVEGVISGSSANKAGVLEGDRIMKVNKTSVVNYKHEEVGDMIRNSEYVSLTLLGKHAGKFATGKDAMHKMEISQPQHLQELTIQSLKEMLSKQRQVYRSLSVEFSKAPSLDLEKQLKDCESIIKILEGEIASKYPLLDAHIRSTDAAIQAVTSRSSAPKRAYSVMEDKSSLLRRMKSNEHHDDTDYTASTGSKRPGSKKHTADSPNLPRHISFNNSESGSLSPKKKSRFPKLTPVYLPSQSEAGDLSDEDLEEDAVSDLSPFSSLKELKGNPAHMAVFLHYLITNLKDPRNLCFYLVANSYQSHCKSPDLRQRGTDIYWTFFLDNSPLQLNVSEAIKAKISASLENEEADKLRNMFTEARDSLTDSILSSLSDYQKKRILGLGWMYGDQHLSNKMSSSKEMEVINSTLLQDLKQWLEDKSATDPEEILKNQALAACIATFMLDVNIKKDEKNIMSTLEKVQSFSRGDITLKKRTLGKKRGSIVSKQSHSFQLTSFQKPTTCDFCQKLMWGITYHGYRCLTCDCNCHKFCEANIDVCPGKGRGSSKKKPPPTRKISFSLLPSSSEEVERTHPQEPQPNQVEEEGGDNTQMNSQAVETGGTSMIDGDRSVNMRRARAVSDPKLMLQVTVQEESQSTLSRQQQTEKKNRDSAILRTQSARMDFKPPHATAVSDSNTLAPSVGSSEDSLLESTPGDRLSGKSLLQADDELIKELLDGDIQDVMVPWALSTRKDVTQQLKKYEVQRQELIKELVYTERTHMQKLKIMRYMYKIPLKNKEILTSKQVDELFPSLEELILFHNGLCEDLKERAQSAPVVKNIADVLLQRFDGAAGERLCHACSVFASNQAKAERVFKEWKRKEKFRNFVKEAEAHPLCHRLTLTDLIPIAWTRLTRYKILIDGILESYKRYIDDLSDTDKEEMQKIELALGCVKNILHYVNKQVRRSENKQKLQEYQSKLDTSALEKSPHPLAQLFKSLDLTADNRRLIHEGPLTWRIQHRRIVELHALLLTDILVLMERNEDKDRYYLRCYTLEKINGTKEELCPVIRLKETLLRHAAVDRGHRTFFVVNNSSLMKLAQMYEFIAEGTKEKKRWEDAITRAMQTAGTPDALSPELPSSPVTEDYNGKAIPHLSNLSLREQLDKIDDDTKKLLNEKLNVLRIVLGLDRPPVVPQVPPPNTSGMTTAREAILAAIDKACEIVPAMSHIMVPNPTKGIIADTQSKVTNIVTELQRTLSKAALFMETSIPVPLDLGITAISTAETKELEPALVSTSFAKGGTGASLGSSSIDFPDDALEGTDAPSATGVNVNIPSISAVSFDLPSLLETPTAQEDDIFAASIPWTTDEQEHGQLSRHLLSVGEPSSDLAAAALNTPPPEEFATPLTPGGGGNSGSGNHLGDESITPTPQSFGGENAGGKGFEEESEFGTVTPVISPGALSSPMYLQEEEVKMEVGMSDCDSHLHTPEHKATTTTTIAASSSSSFSSPPHHHHTHGSPSPSSPSSRSPPSSTLPHHPHPPSISNSTSGFKIMNVIRSNNTSTNTHQHASPDTRDTVGPSPSSIPAGSSHSGTTLSVMTSSRNEQDVSEHATTQLAPSSNGTAAASSRQPPSVTMTTESVANSNGRGGDEQQLKECNSQQSSDKERDYEGTDL